MLDSKQFKNITNEIINEFNLNGNSKKFNTLYEDILNNASIKQIISFTNAIKNVIKDVDIKKFGAVVASDGSVEQNFQFAQINGCDSRLHRDIILQSQDIEFNLRAGKQLDDEYREEYVNKHGAIVLKGTAYQNLKYLSNNKAKSLNRQAHFDAIINSNNAYINYVCAKEVKDADILAHGQAVINSGEVAINLAYAHIKGADVDAHLKVVLEYGSENDWLEALQTFDTSLKSQFVVKIFDSDDNKVKIDCLRWLESKGLLEKAKKLNSVYDFIEQLQNGYITNNYTNKL